MLPGDDTDPVQERYMEFMREEHDNYASWPHPLISPVTNAVIGFEKFARTVELLKNDGGSEHSVIDDRGFRVVAGPVLQFSSMLNLGIGDLILEIDGNPVSSRLELVNRLEDVVGSRGSSFAIIAEKRGSNREITVYIIETDSTASVRHTLDRSEAIELLDYHRSFIDKYRQVIAEINDRFSRNRYMNPDSDNMGIWLYGDARQTTKDLYLKYGLAEGDRITRIDYALNGSQGSIPLSNGDDYLAFLKGALETVKSGVPYSWTFKIQRGNFNEFQIEFEVS